MQQTPGRDLRADAEEALGSYKRAFGSSQKSPESIEAAHWNLIEVVTDPQLLARLVKRPEAQVLYQFTVELFATNVFLNMHGGSQAIVAENCTNCTASAIDQKKRKPSLSIEAQFSYHLPIELDTTVYVLTEVEKSSRRFSTVRYTIFDANLRLASSGKSTKAFELQKL